MQSFRRASTNDMRTLAACSALGFILQSIRLKVISMFMGWEAAQAVHHTKTALAISVIGMHLFFLYANFF